MNKFAFLIVLAALFVATSLNAQNNQIPRLSPPGQLTQMVGKTTVTIDYLKTVARGREIFGGLVSYDSLWHTGGGVTTIEFDRPVTIGEQAVPAGKYSLLTVPAEKEWVIMLNTDPKVFGSHNYDGTKDVARLTVPVMKPGRFYESLSFDFDVTPHNAKLYISWTDVQVVIPINTPSEENVMAHIDSLLSADLLTNTEGYFFAYNYLHFNKVHLEKAIALTNRSLQVEDSEYPYRMQAKMFILMGDKKSALGAIEKGEVIVRRKFANNEERLVSMLKHYAEERKRIEGL